MTDDRPRRPAVGVCVFRDARVLLVRRGRAPALGKWAPVGGRVEPGESAAEAALREVAEETGVACRLIGESGRRDIAARDADGTAFVHAMVVFAAEWTGGEPVAGDDAAEARWVAPDEIADLDLVDGAGPHIAAARRLVDGSRAADALSIDPATGSGAAPDEA